MKKLEILKKRRDLKACAGKSEYAFFTSILLSAAALCTVLVLAVELFMESPEVSQAYGEFISGGLSLPKGQGSFFSAAAEVLGEVLLATLKSIPAAIGFFLTLLFVVLPIYQGTIRWSAYLVEEGSALPIRAILFYFLSPSLYFSSVLLSLRIFLRKALFALAFLLPPLLCLALSLVLGSDYYGEKALAGANLILSVLWLILSFLLYIIFCQRYAAVRYLFSLGSTKRLFRRSCELTKNRRAWFFTFKLMLLPNLLLVFLIFTAPLAISRMLCASSLAVKELILEKKRA